MADGIGIIGAFFALKAWIQTRQITHYFEFEKHRQTQRIRIVLSHGDEQFELPMPLLRYELTRQEVLGRIGMIPMKKGQKRFSIRYLNTIEFWEQLTQIWEGQSDGILTIPLKEDELEQFDLSIK